jgi:hypothetical protein
MLYSLFIRHRSLSLQPLFARIRPKLGKDKQYEYAYDVMFYAFTHLSPTQLIDFLRWAGPLYPSPQAGRFGCDLTARTLLVQADKSAGAIKQTKSSTRVYDYYFLLILKSPDKLKPWEQFIRWILANHHDSNTLNRHMVCVCEMMARMLSKARPDYNLQPHLSALLRSEPQSGRIKENLIYFACEYIRQSDDKEMARMLLLALYRGSMTLPKVAWPVEMETFCTYCHTMLDETQDPLYADLLVRMRRRRLTTDEIERLLPYASDKSFVSDALVEAYKNGKDLRTVERLLASLHSGEGDSYRTRCLRTVWQTVVFNQDKTGYENLSDEEFDSLRQACVEVLGSYYPLKKLKDYVHGEAPLAFKMLLCAQFVGIYDERLAGDLFLNTSIDMTCLCGEAPLLHAYLLLTERQCLAELQYNTDYGAFYKYRRYVKLLVISAIREEEDGTDALIEANDHRSIAEEYNYDEFKNVLLPQLMASLADDPCGRTYFLLCLLAENVQPYFQAYAEHLSAADPLLRSTVKKMIRHLDFRTINSRFFVQNVEDMAAGQYEGVIRQAMLLSDEMHEIVSYLAAHRNPSLLYAVKHIFDRHDVTAACVDIFNACGTKPEEEQALWASVICAKQLPSKVVSGIRHRIVTKQAEQAEAKQDFDFELDVIYRYHSDESKGYYVERMRDCEHYLWCLRNYLRGDFAPGAASSPRRLAEQIERARNEIAPHRLPREWQSEAKRFLEQDWQEEGFEPDRINVSHWSGAAQRFAFVDTLLPLFADGEEAEDLTAALEICQDDTLDSEVRIGAGLSALRAYGRADGTGRTYQQLVVCVGKLLIESDREGLDAAGKLAVFLELSSRYDNDDQILGWLKEFCNELTVEDWLSRYQELYAVLSDAFRSSHEYCAAIWRFLGERGVHSLDPEACSMTDLLHALEVRCEVSDDAYIECVRAAAKRRYEALGRYRLHVRFEGISAPDARTSYAYFTVMNGGSEVIHLQNRIQLRKDQKSSGTGVEIGIADLRPGWITGCRYRINWGEEQQATLSITIKGEGEGSLPLYRAEWVVEKPAAPAADSPRPVHELYEAARAVGQHEALFGRAREEREILSALAEQGFAIITGPSRIGKTSIMNRLFGLAKERGNVVTVSFADANHDEGDYEYAFYDAGKRVTQVAAYLLSDGLRYGLEPKYQRVSAPEAVDLSAVHSTVSAILQEGGVSRKDQYSAINRYLGEQGLELWVMLDEFQQIIEREPSADDMRQIKEVLATVFHAEEKHIKLIFCGSDNLHKAIGSTDNAWRDVLSAGYSYSTMPNWIRVGAIAEQDFYRMLSHKTLSYTEEAMMAAAAYAANIPLYGKQICNNAIKQRKAQPAQDDGVLYCYDIATAVQRTFENEAVGIIKAVIKGLSELDVLCLSYLARSLQQGVSLADTWRALHEACGTSRLRAMTEYLKNARLLLKDSGTGTCDFSSAFFYNAFCIHAKNREVPVILDQIASLVNGTQDQRADELLASVGDLDDNQQARVLRGFKADALADAVWNNETARRELRERIRSVDDGQNLYTFNNYGQMIGHQEVYVRIDKQVITTLLSGDPNSEGYAKALSAMRRENYLDEETKREVGRLQGKIALLQSPEADDETQAEIAALEEQIEEKTAPAGAELVKDVLSSVPIDEWLKIDDACWMRLLGIDEAELSRVKSLDAYLTSLNFAILIHNVLNGIYENIGRGEPGPERDARLSDFDFSPVSILYCKVVEAMLNREHMPLFQQCFPDYVYDPGKGKTFGEWTTADKPLEIGKFHFVLTDSDKQVRAARRQLLAEASGVSADQWKKHTTAMNTVRPIRNSTAHDITPMHHNEFEKLIKTLFPDGELLLIWDLAHGCT